MLQALVWLVPGVLIVGGINSLPKRWLFIGPLALIAAGALLALVPFVSAGGSDPSIVLSGLLPPLVFALGVQCRGRQQQLPSGFSAGVALSIGTVVFTTVAVGVVAWVAIPQMTLAVSLAFGAAVAPTAIAGLPTLRRSSSLSSARAGLLQREGLVNYATAALLLNLALIADVIGSPIGLQDAGSVVWTLLVGGAVGAIIGGLTAWARTRFSDATFTTITLITGAYLAYALAELVGGSGYLAVAVAGLIYGNATVRRPLPAEGLLTRTQWQAVTTFLGGGLYFLVGTQLPAAASTITVSALPISLIATIFLTMTLARPVWILLATALLRLGPPRIREHTWSWRTAIETSATNSRGAFTLASLLLLPSGTFAREQLVALSSLLIVLSVAQTFLADIVLAPVRHTRGGKTHHGTPQPAVKAHT